MDGRTVPLGVPDSSPASFPHADVGSALTLHGWVSYSRPNWPGFFLQTDAGGRYCELAQVSAMPTVGTVLDVRGWVAEGRQRFLRVTEMKWLGERGLPPASACGDGIGGWSHAMGNWCRVSGVVVGETRIEEGVQWLVSVGDTQVWVRLSSAQAGAFSGRRWSRVEVEGVVSEEEARAEGGWRTVVWVPERGAVRELESSATVLASLPVVEAGAWERSPGDMDRKVVRVRGVVTMVLPRALALESPRGSAWVNLEEVPGATPAELGHCLEVVGWLSGAGPAKELRQGEVVALRETGHPLPEMVLKDVERLRAPGMHGRRVGMEGEILHRSVGAQGDLLICSAGAETFEVGLRFPGAQDGRKELQRGARIHLAGVVRHVGPRQAAMSLPRILVGRDGDLRVVRRPPWPAHWTARLVAGLSLALAAGVIGMAFAYQRLRVTHQRLEATEGDLRRLNQELEGRVASGLAELARSNDLLREEDARRRAAMERLQEQERRLVEAQAIARTGSFHWEVGGDRLRWSPEMYSLCGVAPESFVPTLSTWLSCVHAEDRSRVEAGLRSALETGRDLTQELRLVTGRGEVRWGQLRARVVAGESGGVEAVEGTCQDITDRKLAELALRSSEARLAESERRFRSLVEGTEVVVWEYDPGTASFTYVSPQAARYGYPLAEWLKPGFWERSLHPDDRKAAVEYCEQSVRLGLDHRLQYRMYTADRRLVWVDDVVTVDSRPEGGVILRGVFVDVTVLKEAEQQRMQLESRLHQAQKMEAIGTVAGGVAHDFNNVLGIITGTADLVRRGTPDAAGVRESMEDILEASRRGRELVQRMLEFSRREEVRRESLSLDALVSDSVRLLRASCPEDVQLELAVEAGIPPLLGDPIQLQRVVANLVSNAWQALAGRPGRVQVELSAGRVPSEEVKTPSARPGDAGFVRLRVSDDGPGMDASVLKRVFEPFFTTKGSGGTGLGLSVVHGIVRAHGGWVVVESEPGQGATFDVYLPMPQGLPSRTR